MAASAKTPADTYGAILYALGQLQQAGDVHTGFVNAFTAKLQAQGGAAIGGATRTPSPTVSLVDRKLGFIVVPAIGSPYTSPNAHRYSSTALSHMAALQTRGHPCGWIVDLRQNTGGDDYPMLLSVAPILGDGHLIGFTGRKGFTYWTSYRNNTLSEDGITETAPVKVANFAPAPAVAVLTGPLTVSAGEVVAVAFRGRAHTKSFGAATAGATTAPQTYRLADGAEMHFAVVWYVDRHGIVYKHPLKPDFAFPDSALASTVEQAATKWLLSTTACSHTR
jgi:C-terminal processing protease CtpA/Prc